MREISLEELLEAGCHFGHQVTRHNPRSRDFVFEARDNIHIIDLVKTKEGLEQAGTFVRELARKGGSMIVIGTKRQARPIVEEETKRAAEAGAEGLYYVTNRWIGGILTNFAEMTKNFKKLKDFRALLASDDEKARYTKKEIGLWEKKRQKLESFYHGIVEMPRIPDALFIIDTHQEDLAVREAQAMGVPAVGIVDTNADPADVEYAIPANDDAVGSLKLITSYIIDSWIEGKKQKKEGDLQTQKTKEKADAAASASTSNVAEANAASAEEQSKKEPKETKKEEKKDSNTTEEKPKAKRGRKAKAD